MVVIHILVDAVVLTATVVAEVILNNILASAHLNLAAHIALVVLVSIYMLTDTAKTAICAILVAEVILVSILVLAECLSATVVAEVILISIRMIAKNRTAIVIAVVIQVIILVIKSNAILEGISTAEADLTASTGQIINSRTLAGSCVHKSSVAADSQGVTMMSYNRTILLAANFASFLLTANFNTAAMLQARAFALGTNLTGLGDAVYNHPIMCCQATVLLAATIAGCLSFTCRCTTYMAQCKARRSAAGCTSFRSGTSCILPAMYMFGSCAAASGQSKQRAQYKHKRK